MPGRISTLLRRRPTDPSSSYTPSQFSSTPITPSVTHVRAAPPLPQSPPPPYSLATAAADICPNCCDVPKQRYGSETPFLAGVLVTFIVLYGLGWLSSGRACEDALEGVRADLGVVYAQLRSLQEGMGVRPP